jgi:hypothetical protein
MGLYTVLGILFLFLVRREIDHGPIAARASGSGPAEVPAEG